MSDSHQPNIVGHWVSVEERMPDDGITCLVWSAHLEDATLAAHDSLMIQEKEYSGWFEESGRQVDGVTHWCDDVRDPNETAGD